jgi:hypothetical protein
MESHALALFFYEKFYDTHFQELELGPKSDMHLISSFFFFFFAVLDMEPRALCMLSKHCTTELYTQPLGFWGFFFLVVLGLELRASCLARQAF